MATAIVVDNGEPNLPKCIASLRRQTHAVRIVVAPGPQTDVRLAEELADEVLEPIRGIGAARVNAIMKVEDEFIISCDSDCIYDERYVEYAVQDLERYNAVKAGSIMPIEDLLNLLGWLEAAFSVVVPYEFALAFRRSAFLEAGCHLDVCEDPRCDIGLPVMTKLHPVIDWRMKVYARMPTYGAKVAASLTPSIIGGLTPLATVTAIIATTGGIIK